MRFVYGRLHRVRVLGQIILNLSLFRVRVYLCWRMRHGGVFSGDEMIPKKNSIENEKVANCDLENEVHGEMMWHHRAYVTATISLHIYQRHLSKSLTCCCARCRILVIRLIEVDPPEICECAGFLQFALVVCFHSITAMFTLCIPCTAMYNIHQYQTGKSTIHVQYS